MSVRREKETKGLLRRPSPTGPNAEKYYDQTHRRDDACHDANHTAVAARPVPLLVVTTYEHAFWY